MKIEQPPSSFIKYKSIALYTYKFEDLCRQKQVIQKDCNLNAHVHISTIQVLCRILFHKVIGANTFPPIPH